MRVSGLRRSGPITMNREPGIAAPGECRSAAGSGYPGRRRVAGRGVTLIELLCVIAILAILASLLLPAVWRAYSKAKGMSEEWEAPEIANLLCNSSRNYCAANPGFYFTNKSDFAEKCALAPKCRDWMDRASTEFVPFHYLTSTNLVVLSVHLGRREATLYSFPRGQLSIQPEQR